METEITVLRKMPYLERHLIVSGISPDYGRLGFMLKGGAGGMNRAFSEVEVFRKLKIEFHWGTGDLHLLDEILEVQEDYGAVSKDYSSFTAASWLGGFSLLNIMPMLAHPHYCNALDVALRRLAEGNVFPEAVLTGACLAFVFEEGWLSAIVQNEQASAQCRQLLEMAAGMDVPLLSEDCWRAQFEWVRGILLANDCKLPCA